MSYSDFRSSKTSAQQLIKHLNICPGQQSLREFKENTTELFLLLKKSIAVLQYYYLQAYNVWSPELPPFVIKAHSTFEPERNMMPGSSCVPPEKLAEASQLLVTRQKRNKWITKISPTYQHETLHLARRYRSFRGCGQQGSSMYGTVWPSQWKYSVIYCIIF